MHESFKHAAHLQPENFDYQLRFAQSFFDFKNSNSNAGLIAWQKLLMASVTGQKRKLITSSWESQKCSLG